MMTKRICSIACVYLLAVASFASADSNAALIGTITDASGGRVAANYFMVDGVSANVGISPLGAQNSSGSGSGIQTNAFGGYSNFVSVDAMQEFRIKTSSYAPEYGRLPGGQISIVSRSGSNAFHGDAFEYYRDTKFDANNWFNIASGAPRPPDRSDDWGGVIGGPILKNRVFLFASRGTLTVSVKDRQGNLTRIVRSFSIPGAQ